MADTEKTVIIKIDLDVNEYTKKSIELNKEIKELTDAQKVLAKSGQTTGLAFQQNKEKLATLSRELRENNKIVQDVTRANQSNAGSNEQLRAQLSVLTAQYNKLSEEERENTHAGKEMAQNVAVITSALKKNESAVGDNRRNVGNYKGALAELKTELKLAKSAALEAAAAFGVGSKQFQDAAKKAGQLKDEMDDVNSATKELGTGSALGQFKNQLGGVGTSIRDLDFDEAAQKAKGLTNTVSKMSFSGVIQGAKGFAVTIYEVGAAMMALPIFWIVAGIAAITAAFVMASKEASENAQTQIDALDKVQARYQQLSDIKVRLNKAAGQDTDKMELDRTEKNRIYTEKAIKILEKLQATNNGLNEEQTKQLDELRVKRLDLIADVGEANINAIMKKSAQDIKAFENEAKLTADVRAKRIAENEKLLEEQRRFNEERLAENKRYLELIQDQQIDLIRDDEERELAKATLDNSRRQEEIVKSKADNDVKFKAFLSQEETYEKNVIDIRNKYAKIKQDNYDRQVDAQIKSDAPRIAAAQKTEDEMEKNAIDSQNAILDNYLKTLKEEEAAAKTLASELKRLQDASFDLTIQGINTVAAVRKNQNDSELIAIEKETQVKIDNLQAQADAGIISQDDFQTKSNRIKLDAQKKEAVIKKKQFEDDKKLALIMVAIKTAEAVVNALASVNPYVAAAYVAIALATGALEAAVIQSQPTPAFATGGKVLSGQRIGSNDGRPIQRSNGDNLLASVKTGEVILNERQQRMLGGDKTFQRMGIKGFAEGGFVDGGTFSSSLVNTIDERISAGNQAKTLLENLPEQVVVVQDINEVQGRTARVSDRADI